MHVKAQAVGADKEREAEKKKPEYLVPQGARGLHHGGNDVVEKLPPVLYLIQKIATVPSC